MSRTGSEHENINADVVDVADFRIAGGAPADMAETIAERATVGLRTGLVQINGPADGVAPLAGPIRRCLDRRQAELLLPHQRVWAKVAVVWQPDALPCANGPAVHTDQVIVIGNAERQDDAIRQACLRYFGQEPQWRPSPPAPADLTSAVEASGPAERIAGDQYMVLMVSSNGTGMGHLTRLLAYSRKAPSGIRPYFLSLSEAVSVVAEFGFPHEYVPSAAPTGMAPARWRNYLSRRLSEAVERLQPAVVVFDGAWAYEAIEDVRNTYPDVRWIWSRRGMWYRGMNRDQLAKSAWFDEVLEPGDFSAPADPGVTAGQPAVRVGPVTLLDRDELLSRAGARSAFGLAADAPTALVTLGAGNINDATSTTRVVIDTLRTLGLEICVTVPAIAARAGTEDEHVHLVNTYPLSRYYHAFDVAVSAAGYNSFHELLRFGVPTLFLPNLDTSLDDQRTRARYAADQGWAFSLDEPEPHVVHKRLDELLHDGPAMVAKVAAVDPGNGAAQAMALVTDLVRGRS